MQEIVSYEVLNLDLNDIFFKVNFIMNNQDYIDDDYKKRREMIIDSIKIYLINKLNEANICKFSSEDSLTDIVQYICIHQENKDSICNLIHYLMSAISILQGYEVYWEINSKFGEEERMLHVNSWYFR